MFYHITCHVIAPYHENIHQNCITMSVATSSKFVMKRFVTKFLTGHLPCDLPHHHIYDKHFCHKGFATSPIALFHHVIKSVTLFLLIVIVLHLLQTFYDGGLSSQ
jgi:hypothetical protein